MPPILPGAGWVVSVVRKAPTEPGSEGERDVTPTVCLLSSRRKHAFPDQLATQRDRQGIIDRHHLNRHSTRRGKAPEARAMPLEMVISAIEAGMIELR